MVICGTRTAKFGKSLENANHALSILGKEDSSLLQHLLVVQPSGENGGDNNSEDRVKQVIVLSKSIRVINIYSRQNCYCIDGMGGTSLTDAEIWVGCE
jgi:hypothetical protein